MSLLLNSHPKNRPPLAIPRSPQLPGVMPSSDIPLELWLRIANYIPPHMLKNLMSVNQAFFYAEMEERYKEVGLFQVNERMLRIVDRLE